MADVTGLTPGDQVDIAGVPVGQVSSVTLQRGHALVAMSLDSDVVLHTGTDVGLRWYNVLGQKQLYLYPEPSGPLLGPGATIPLSHDVSDASVDAFLNAIGPFLQSINTKQANEFVENVSGALVGDTAEIDQLIDSGATVSKTVGALDSQVGAVIDNLDQVLTAIASKSSDVSTLVGNLQTVAQSLASHNDVLDAVVSNLSSVAGDLATLIGQNRSTLDGSIANLETVTRTIADNQQNLAKSLSTLGSGLSGYVAISSYGQWFQVQTVYTCLANQTACTYYEPNSPPAGSAPGGGPPLGLPTTLGASTPGSVAPSSIPSILRRRRGDGGGTVKAVTERDPRTIGLVGLSVMAVVVLGVIFLNRSMFQSGYEVSARFPNAAGVGKGTVVMVAGVPVGTVGAVTIDGNAVDLTMTIDHGVVLPRHTSAAIEVETLLGVEDVTLDPVSGWSSPLAAGAVITDTSVPTQLFEVQNSAGKLLAQTDATALNSVIESLAAITHGKQQQVAQIIQGLGALTTTVDQRSGQVGQLIDAANTLSSTLAGRDQQLTSVIDNLNVVVSGLATHSADLAGLIDNIDAAAGETNGLVSQEQPALNGLLQNLHTTLGVVGSHQDDLAETVSYLAAALKGFASVGYSGPDDTPNTWANIYNNAVATAGLYGVIGPCGALTTALDDILGPDPLACNEQTGPLPGATPSNLAPGPATDPTTGSAAAAGPTPSTASTGPTPAPAAAAPGSAGGPAGAIDAPDSGLAGLAQLLAPLVGGGGS